MPRLGRTTGDSTGFILTVFLVYFRALIISSVDRLLVEYSKYKSVIFGNAQHSKFYSKRKRKSRKFGLHGSNFQGCPGTIMTLSVC